MRTPCPFCGAVVSACDCEAEYLVDVEPEELAKALRKHGWKVEEP